MCECNAINMPEESCDSTCQESRPKTYVDRDGLLVIESGGTIETVDPSKLPGYYGEFKA